MDPKRHLAEIETYIANLEADNDRLLAQAAIARHAR